jgi:hypothetical protein
MVREDKAKELNFDHNRRDCEVRILPSMDVNPELGIKDLCRIMGVNTYVDVSSLEVDDDYLESNENKSRYKFK